MEPVKMNNFIKTPIDRDLGNVYEYIKNNFGSILLVVIGFFLVMAYTAVNNINFEQTEKTLDKKFIIETFIENITKMVPNTSINKKTKLLKSKKKISSSVCEGRLDIIDNKCKNHKYQSVCTSYNCCNWGQRDNKFQCVGGGKDGPTFGAQKFDIWY